MKWFKHDTNAYTDAKIKKLIRKHKAIGYAVYFHTLELIYSDFEETNLTTKLEHDIESIADNLKIDEKSVIEVIKTCLELSLFQTKDDDIFCTKIVNRIDSSMNSNPNFRKKIKDIKDSHDTVMIESHDTVMRGVMHSVMQGVMQEENRIEEKRIDKNRTEEIKEIDFTKKDNPFEGEYND